MSKTELISPSSTPSKRALTATEFQGLAEVPPELEWFANITNAKTRRDYQFDVKDFTRFVGIVRPEEFRIVTRAHLIAWRKIMEGYCPKKVFRWLREYSGHLVR